MKSIRTMLLLAVAALAVLAVPATASANWTIEGKELGSLGWSQEGWPLKSETTISTEGNLGWKNAALGSVDCPMSATITMNPAEGGTAGALGKFSSNPAACKTGGQMAINCTGVTSVVGPSITAAFAKEVNGTKVIEVPSLEVNYEFSGQKACEDLDLTVSGALIATPDNSGQISSLSLSGQLKTTPNFGKVNVFSSTLNVTPAAKYGISIAGAMKVDLDGTINWANATLGSRLCEVEGEAILEAGNGGRIVSLAPTTETCPGGGPAGSYCSSPFVFSALPWGFVNEGTSITIKGVSIGECYMGTFIGDLKATPNKSGAISYTILSGTLKSGGITMAWQGKLNWTPAGVYGL